MTKKRLKVLVLGGRGFVGSAICKNLRLHKVFTFDRHSGGKNHYQGNILHVSDLKKAFKGKDIVINLVGLTPLRKPKGEDYKAIHIQGVKNVIKACKSSKVKRLIHMSILGANKKSEIEFFKTRGIGEDLVLKSRLKVTVIKPSLIFDKDNELIRMFSKTAFTLFCPKIPTKMQPVYKQDIAKIYALAVNNKIKEKKIEVGGPDILTVFGIGKKIYNKKRFPCIPIPTFIVKLGMIITSKLNLFGIGKDQIKSLEVHNLTKINMAPKYIELTSFDKWLKRTKV